MRIWDLIVLKVSLISWLSRHTQTISLASLMMLHCHFLLRAKFTRAKFEFWREILCESPASVVVILDTSALRRLAGNSGHKQMVM